MTCSWKIMMYMNRVLVDVYIGLRVYLDGDYTRQCIMYKKLFILRLFFIAILKCAIYGYLLYTLTYN